MPVPLEKFVQQLEDSQVLDGDTLKEFLPPNASPASAEELARKLVRREKLTKFQATEISRGKGKSLVLGNYVLVEKIGAGGMGQVFKARHRVMDRLVALKVLPGAVTKDQTAISRFHREVKAAAKLNHPNIVTAYDADQAGGVHFLVMELVEGSDLSAFVKKNGPFPLRQAVNCILQAAKGLEFVHKKGVVHRDIKPANLLLDREGTVKILDMGLARVHEETPQPELTSTGAVMGTVDYMAPEQALSSKTADARADIYALGCSLHYLLTGKSTYHGETVMAKLLAHRDMPIPRLSDFCLNVPAQVDSVFQKMVAKNAEDRYQSMAEVMADLELGIADLPSPLTDHASSSTTVEFAVTLPASPMASEEAEDFFLPSLDEVPAKTGKTKKSKFVFAKNLPLIGAAVLGVAMLAALVVWFANSGGKPIAKVNRAGTKVSPTNKSPKNKSPKNKSLNNESPKNDSSEFKFAPVMAKPQAFKTAGFDRWVKEIAARPAESQVDAVSQKLKDLNPGFDGRLASPLNEWSPPVIQDGKVVELRIYTDNVVDLSPLRAFSELKVLLCLAKNRTGPQLDLEPLAGMKIRTLTMNGPTFDLHTLKGLSLSELACYGGGITDLTPISRMPLQLLVVSGNWELRSLEPLRGMQLTTLACDNLQVADLSPLSGMPLKHLFCHVTGVKDLAPLTGMPLEELSCDRTLITDLSPLASTKLQRLSFTPKPELKGVSAIRQMDSLVQIAPEYSKLIPRNEFWKQYDAGAFNVPK